MYTVLSAFDARDAAERAVELLVKEGFPRQNTHIEANGDQDRADDRIASDALASAERETAVGPLAVSAMAHFFDRLLGRKEHAAHAHTYSEAVRRGGAVAVVDTSSEIAAERAATVMHENGAYDIAERAEQWRRDGWSAVASSGEQQLPDGAGVLRWRTAYVIHRPSEPPLSEVLGRQPGPEA